MATKTTTIPWHEVDKTLDGLSTDVEHEIQVQREAIPLVFVPGIMGTCLRRAGTTGAGDGPDGLPTMRWNPSGSLWMFRHFSGTSGGHRKAMLVGDRFDPGYLEVANDVPLTDGFSGIMADYTKFLNPLRQHDWGALAKIFVFPVYAVGYNWTDSNENSGTKLKARLEEIVAEAGSIVGLCEKVILISHSMGGLVCRWASEIEGAKASVLGIIHAVQPGAGVPAAYWRVKAGFEGFGLASRVLGNSGPRVTPVLGNIPGGLQLLPNKLYQTNSGATAWLTVTGAAIALPSHNPPDPYDEIYRVKAVVQPAPGGRPSTNAYWGLIDPDLLDPDAVRPESGNTLDELDASVLSDESWSGFLRILAVAESFHDTLGKKAHDHTFSLGGVGHHTVDAVEMRVESNWVRSDPYPTRGFRGFFTDANGKSMQAVLQDGSGVGDGTVPRSSSAILDDPAKPLPGDVTVSVEHQPAFENGDVQAFTIQAITALCRIRYQEKRGRVA